MINIITKFKPGDNLYTIVEAPILKKCKCNLCESSGQVDHKGTPILCPKCKGKDLTEDTGYTCWEVIDEPVTVTAIRVKYHNPERYFISYKASGYKRSGDNLFHSKQEAINKCNELNKALIPAEKEQIQNKREIRYEFKINNKFNIGDNVYTVKKDFDSKKEDFFKPLEDTYKINSIRLTIYGENSFDVRYKLDRMARQESRVFSNIEEAISKCEELNKNEVVWYNISFCFKNS